MFGPIKRVHKSIRPVRLAHVRDQVRGVFARVLERDPGVRVEMLDGGTLNIEFRDRHYLLVVYASMSTISVSVSKDLKDDGVPRMTADAFFYFTCPLNRMPKIRKTALILYKKMQHAEVYEVMTA